MLPVYRVVPLLAGALLLGACALQPSAPPQQIELHAMFGDRELIGVDCVVSNVQGRWPVVVPGRVTVRASAPLKIECNRPRTAWQQEVVVDRPDLGRLHGNVLLGEGKVRTVRLPSVMNVPMQLMVPAPRAGDQALAQALF